MRGTVTKSVGRFLTALGFALTIGWSVTFAVPQATNPRPSQTSDQQKQSAPLVAEGIAALERGDLTKAKASFERVLKLNPAEVTALTYLGVLADRAGKLPEAEQYFAAAAAAAPASAAARNNYGAVLLRLGQTEKAAGEFEASLQLNQEQLNALINLAQIRFGRGTVEGLRQARSLFNRAYGLAPDAEIARALVIIALRLNEREAAVDYYRTYTKHLVAADSKVLAPSRRAELGRALLAAGLAQEAVSELTPVVAAAPSDSDLIVLLALAQLALKDIPAAGRTLEAAVARGLDAAPIYATLAEVYQLSGHLENAIPALKLAVDREPTSEAYRFRYGMLLVDAKAPAAAAIRLQEAVTAFPQSVKLWFALGIAYFTDHKNEEAAKAFQTAVQLEPKFATGLAYLGMTYTELGRYTEAIELYEQAIAVEEKLAPAHYLVGEALLKQTSGDLARAESHLARAAALDPGFAPAHAALAKLYLRTNRLAEAANHLEQAIKADPNLAEAHYQLGRVYTRLKRPAEAEVAFATFKQLSEAQKAQSRTARQELLRRLANVKF